MVLYKKTDKSSYLACFFVQEHINLHELIKAKAILVKDQ